MSVQSICSWFSSRGWIFESNNDNMLSHTQFPTSWIVYVYGFPPFFIDFHHNRRRCIRGFFMNKIKKKLFYINGLIAITNARAKLVVCGDLHPSSFIMDKTNFLALAWIRLLFLWCYFGLPFCVFFHVGGSLERFFFLVCVCGKCSYHKGVHWSLAFHVLWCISQRDMIDVMIKAEIYIFLISGIAQPNIVFVLPIFAKLGIHSYCYSIIILLFIHTHIFMFSSRIQEIRQEDAGRNCSTCHSK